MKKNSLIIFIIVMILLAGSLYSQNTYNVKLKFITSLDLNRWTILDDFDFTKGNKWEGSSTGNSTHEPMVTIKKMSLGAKFSATEGGRFLSEEYSKNSSCLGIKILYPEFYQASVFIRPNEGIVLNGKCKKIAVWLLGRGQNIDIEIVLLDYLGNNYYLPAGKIDHLGWKYFEVDIPVTVPQNFNSYPQQETLEFSGFIISNNPERYIDKIHKPIYIYIDHLESLMDRNRAKYPGVEITDDW